MGAYTKLQDFFPEPLETYAIEFGYPSFNLLILQGNLQQLQASDPQIYANLLSCGHQSDGRTPLEYGHDLVASWIFEDYLIKQLQPNTYFTLTHGGADRERTILANGDVSNDSDYRITGPDGTSLQVELVCDYSNFWENKHKMHLRDNKYVHMQENHGLLLAVCVSDTIGKFLIEDFRREVPATYIPYHRPYKKPAYEISVPRNMLKTFSVDAVVNALRECLDNIPNTN